MRVEAIHRLLLVGAMAVAVGTALPASASAVFGPIQLISKSPREQAGVADDPAISADGKYVAFCAELGGREGIFREQLETGQVSPVAVGPIVVQACKVEEFRAPPYAVSPSISADGRYVSFTTSQALVQEDENNLNDVYVADMSTAPPTYELASTEEGSTPMEGGSTAAGRVALSADGNRVAFVNGGNVYVRDFARQETILISATREAVTGAMDQAMPVKGGGAYAPAGAAISADGSTVAWVGEHLPEQVPLAPEEEAAIRTLEKESKRYYEPLWRRVPTPATPTRRIIGGAQGPYPEAGFHERMEFNVNASGYGWGVKLPQLDGNGDRVALAVNPDEQYDLFIVEMQEAPDEGRVIQQVTQWTNPVPLGTVNQEAVARGGNRGEYLPFTGEVSDCTISPDGTRVAFTTTRQHFSMPPYALITELPTGVSQLSELYELDLGSNKIERVTPGPGKDVSTAERRSAANGAVSPSFGAGDRFVAFASEAENLVDGDANENSDVFVVESSPPAAVGKSTISPRPPPRVAVPAWRMTVNAYSRPDGSVRIVATVPGAGTLRVTARSQLGAKLKARRVASGRRRAKATTMVTVDLKLGRGRQDLTRKPGLVTRVHVSFTGHGGRPLHADLESRFVVHSKQRDRGGRQKGGGG